MDVLLSAELVVLAAEAEDAAVVLLDVNVEASRLASTVAVWAGWAVNFADLNFAAKALAAWNSPVKDGGFLTLADMVVLSGPGSPAAVVERASAEKALEAVFA